MNTLKDTEIDKMINRSTNKPPVPRDLFVREIVFDHFKELMVIELKNGKLLAFSLLDYTSLQKATPKQRDNWQLLGGGSGIHWPDIDEDLSIKGLIKHFIESNKSFINKHEALVA